MEKHTKLKWCVLSNLILVGCITVFLCICPMVNDAYMRWGPQADLKLLGVSIDTWSRYWMLQVCLACLTITDVMIQDTANPILGFTIYNPDKKIITEFSKNELQAYAQTIWFLSNIKGALMLMISITQLDISISKCVFQEVGGAVVMRVLLNEKKFGSDDEQAEALLCVVIEG